MKVFTPAAPPDPTLPPVQVVWFKRDLRVHDHAPLTRAAALGPVLPLYVYEPLVYGAAEHDPSHLVFVNESLQELERALGLRGARLVRRQGDAIAVLEALSREVRIAGLWSHEETGLLATFARDRAIKRWCSARGISWEELPQHGVFRPTASRDGWAQRWKRRMGEAPVLAPARIAPAPVVASVGELGPEALALPPSAMPEAQRGGRSAAEATLSSFLTERGCDYRAAMSTPLAGWTACSRISPYLSYGCLSVRESWQATRMALAALPAKGPQSAGIDPRWRPSLVSFGKRLHWNGHFQQKLEDEPELEHRNFSRAYDGLREAEFRPERLAALMAGETGFPMVDAVMRCLARTGWINFRMRAMVMSFAAYHLWLHWKPVGEALARRFLDFEPGIHYSQCQMQSGTTGINTVRVYSPAKQARDQDPEGRFLRRWLPELAPLPAEALAEPDQTPPLVLLSVGVQLGASYPLPIVDPKVAVREAKERLFAVRKQAAARAEAERVYARHGSRRRPAERR